MLRLGDGPLSHALEFLDPKDLSCTERTCRSLRSLSQLAYQALDEALIKKYSSVCQSEALFPKERVQRWYKASRSAQSIESSCSNHFDERSGGSADASITPHSHIQCRGCRAFPDLNNRVFDADFLPEYEFFVRLSYRTDNGLIWQGFVSATLSSHNTLDFDMQHVYPFFHWPSMVQYLTELTVHGFAGARDCPDIYEAIDNLSMTVVAIERLHPYTASLVVATRGFSCDLSNVDDIEHTYMMCPRNVASHNAMDENELQEDWVSVNVLAGQPSPLQPVAFRGLKVTLFEEDE